MPFSALSGNPVFLKNFLPCSEAVVLDAGLIYVGPLWLPKAEETRVSIHREAMAASWMWATVFPRRTVMKDLDLVIAVTTRQGKP